MVPGNHNTRCHNRNSNWDSSVNTAPAIMQMMVLVMT